MTEDLTSRWRAEADVLRRRGCEDAARLLEGCAAELEASRHAEASELLTLNEAALLSGYSVATLRRLIGEGALRDMAPSGSPMVRRGDLPKKPGHAVRPVRLPAA